METPMECPPARGLMAGETSDFTSQLCRFEMEHKDIDPMETSSGRDFSKLMEYLDDQVTDEEIETVKILLKKNLLPSLPDSKCPSDVLEFLLNNMSEYDALRLLCNAFSSINIHSDSGHVRLSDVIGKLAEQIGQRKCIGREKEVRMILDMREQKRLGIQSKVS